MITKKKGLRALANRKALRKAGYQAFRLRAGKPDLETQYLMLLNDHATLLGEANPWKIHQKLQARRIEFSRTRGSELLCDVDLD